MARYVKKSTTTPRKRYMKKPKVSKAVKTYVKSTIKNKKMLYTQESFVVENNASTISPLWYQDDFMQNRWTGRLDGVDKIQSIGIQFSYVLHNNSTTIPVSVRCIVIVNKRGQSNFGSYRSGSNIFQLTPNAAQNETNYSISGTTRDLILPIDNEHYKVLRDFKINLGCSPNDAKNMATGKLWIPYKKILKYDTSSTQFPINDNVALLFLPLEGPNDVSLGINIEVSSRATWYLREP